LLLHLHGSWGSLSPSQSTHHLSPHCAQQLLLSRNEILARQLAGSKLSAKPALLHTIHSGDLPESWRRLLQWITVHCWIPV
ncbi:hypothetical protein PMAYCL1PPCAC_17376, partial [Pristionchus mayeri]